MHTFGYRHGVDRIPPTCSHERLSADGGGERLQLIVQRAVEGLLAAVPPDEVASLIRLITNYLRPARIAGREASAE